MALIHVHRVVDRDAYGDAQDTSHLDSDGESFGHDEHIAFLGSHGSDAGWEHTHNGVEERYDEVQDQISLHRVARERPASSTTSSSTATVSG